MHRLIRERLSATMGPYAPGKTYQREHVKKWLEEVKAFFIEVQEYLKNEGFCNGL